MNWHSKVAPQFRWQEVFAILEQGAGAAKAASNNHHILETECISAIHCKTKYRSVFMGKTVLKLMPF